MNMLYATHQFPVLMHNYTASSNGEHLALEASFILHSVRDHGTLKTATFHCTTHIYDLEISVIRRILVTFIFNFSTDIECSVLNYNLKK